MSHFNRMLSRLLGTLSPLIIDILHLFCVGAELCALLRARMSDFYELHLSALLSVLMAGAQSIRRSRLQTAALCFVPAVIIASFCLEPTLMVQVNGVPLGYVSQAEDLYRVTASIEQQSSILLGTDYHINADISLVPSLCSKGSVLGSAHVENAVAEAIPGLQRVSIVRVDDKIAGVAGCPQDAQTALDAMKARYVSEAGDKADFVEDVAVSSVIADSAAAESLEELQQVLTATDENGNPVLSVSVTRRLAYHEAIPFETITRNNANLAQNKKQVVQSGEEGDASIEASVTLINGKETNRMILSRTVLSEAKDEIIEVGSKNVGFGTGKLRRPMSGYQISSTFKMRNGRMHTGYDLACHTGNSIYAADNGRVVFSGYDNSGYGYYVILDHRNGMQTLYAHCSKLLVKEGDVVAKGDKIAKSGNSGRSTGPHLHFEVRVNGTPVNPSKYVSL